MMDFKEKEMILLMVDSNIPDYFTHNIKKTIYISIGCLKSIKNII
jgi:hypothetical protein